MRFSPLFFLVFSCFRMEAYDRKSGAWISCADMPRKRYGHTLCVDGHVILAVGGLGNDADPIATISSFDTLTGRWTARATLIPEVRIPISPSSTAHGVPLWPAICVLNGFVYVIGGDYGVRTVQRSMFPQTLGRRSPRFQVSVPMRAPYGQPPDTSCCW